MGKLIASTFVTLDGFMAGPNGEMEWVTAKEDPEMENDVANQLLNTDTIILGRVTYQLIAEYWPNVIASTNIQRSHGEEHPIITDKMNNLPKIVFSKSLERVEWKNSRVVKEDVEDEISKLKQESGREGIVIFGSASIVQALTRANLIDEYQFYLYPIILSRGKSLFKDVDERVDLTLMKTKAYRTGVLSLCYRPKEVIP